MKAIVTKLYADDTTGLLHQVGEVLDGNCEAIIERGLAIPLEEKPKRTKKEVIKNVGQGQDGNEDND